MHSLFRPILTTVRSHQKVSWILGSILALGYVFGGITFYQSMNNERCHRDSPQESRMCYRDYYRALTKKSGAKVALADMEKRQLEGNLWNHCHELVHEIGETAGKSGRPLSEIFEEGSVFCRAGYYHGVLAEVVKREGTLSSEFLASACDTLPGKGTGTGLYRHCTHGVGHGLMFATRGDVFDSLIKCGVFSSALDQKECAGGVFMEHFMADDVEHVSQERGKSPGELCASITPEYTDVCYERAGTQFASDNYQIPEKSFALCLGLPASPAQKAKCIEGIGLIALGERDLAPNDPSLLCAHDKDLANRKTCYWGAVNTLSKVAPELGDPRTAACNRVIDPLYKEECLAS